MSSKICHVIAGCGPLLFLVVAGVEGMLRPGYSSIAEPISALSLGPRGTVQVLNFALLSISFLAFAVVLRKALRSGVSSIVAPALFVVMATGAAAAGIFTMDAPGASPTLEGQLHDLAGFLVFPWFSVALFFVAPRLQHDEHFRPYSSYTLATGMFCLATIVFFLSFVGLPSGPPLLASAFRGSIQRIMLLAFFAWIAVFARHAYRKGLYALPTARAIAAM